MVSVFWWEGAVQRSEEALLILKTTAARLRELEARLVELHPYEVPEVLAMGVQGGHEPYLAWVREEVRGKGS
jgi:periplasmic divalent cation tolerance protein